MKEIKSPSFRRLCYGYIKDSNQKFFVQEQQVDTVKLLFQEYLKGTSLALLAEEHPISIRKRKMDMSGHR
jgi:hypothetical protein